MVRQASLLTDLECIVGREHVLSPAETGGFAVDGCLPQAVAGPGSYEQVAEVLRYASKSGLAVVPWGGGSMMHIGNLPRRYDIALSLSRLDRVIEHEPADLTVTCQAGITLSELQRQLRESGQMVPLDSLRHPFPTVGGILAANSWGARRHAFGTPRDFTIGMRVVTADGRITRAGGKVVKNVAGYDLCKLYIGSLGTLGVIVEATFKVQPIPMKETVQVVGFSSAAAACDFAREVQRRGLSVRAAVIESDSTGVQVQPYLLWFWLGGTAAGVDRTLREISELAAARQLDSWESVDGQSRFQRMGWTALPGEVEEGTVGGLICGVTVLPGQVAGATTALSEFGHRPSITDMPTIGWIRAEWTDVIDSEAEMLLEKTRAIVRALGGSLRVLFCPRELKRRIDVFGEIPPSFALIRRIKEQFDPRGVLSPGRFLGRL